MQNMVPRTTPDLFLSVDPYYRQQPNISLEKNANSLTTNSGSIEIRGIITNREARIRRVKI